MAFGLIAAIGLIGATITSAAATAAQVEAQEEAQKAEQRRGSIENTRRSRRAVAQRRVQEAELLQAQATQGARTNSAISGAVGSLGSQTAQSIGASNTQFAAQTNISDTLASGARRALGFNIGSQIFGAASSLSMIGLQQQALNRANTPIKVPRVTNLDQHPNIKRPG